VIKKTLPFIIGLIYVFLGIFTFLTGRLISDADETIIEIMNIQGTSRRIDMIGIMTMIFGVYQIVMGVLCIKLRNNVKSANFLIFLGFVAFNIDLIGSNLLTGVSNIGTITNVVVPFVFLPLCYIFNEFDKSHVHINKIDEFKKIQNNSKIDDIEAECPDCYGKLVLKKDTFSGVAFYGCTNFPDCKVAIKDIKSIAPIA